MHVEQDETPTRYPRPIETETGLPLMLRRLYEVTGYAPRGYGANRSARCPVHDDGKASVSVGTGHDGRVVFNCKAGCDNQAIVDALGIPWPALYPPETRGRQQRDPDGWVPCLDKGHRKVAEYLYTDEHGATLYGVTRCNQKCFAQWRPDRTKKYGRRWSLRDANGDKVRAVPYRLPEVLAAIADERVVMICEGEKDVDNLRARPGITATCNQGGAGMGWPDEFAQYFHRADVSIVADRDEGGRKHARAIVANLMPVARSIYVVQARHGKDASDHLAAGGTIGNLVEVWAPKPYEMGGAA
ncbi:toprim domain-containing protein [Nonomuraea sp. NPDC049480]|uniref:toprim domain-containing protein n=1 Tax=Nonomuraea sp. NPDC049480 TaxID=3364353 RepID=UPI0037B35775